jgi:hypothetical protein
VDDGFALATLTWALLVATGEQELGGAGPAAIGTGLVAISREGASDPSLDVSRLIGLPYAVRTKPPARRTLRVSQVETFRLRWRSVWVTRRSL